MLGISLFYQVYLNLGKECQNRILGNIFGVNDVSVSSVLVNENNVLFRIFGDDVFYQYHFFVDGIDKEILYRKKVVKGLMVIFNDNFDMDTNLVHLLIELFSCQDEYCIYQMMKLFL